LQEAWESEPGVYSAQLGVDGEFRQIELFVEVAGYKGSESPGLWSREDGVDQFIAEFEEDSISNFQTPYSLFSPGLFFEVNGRELWRSDGTPDGTILVDSLVESETVGANDFFAVTAGESRTQGLWRDVNGEEQIVAAFENSISDLTAFGDHLYFVVNDRELWKSDGSEAGTTMVTGGLNGFNELTPAEGFLYFVADDGVHGSEVWRTDGTTDGTVLAADVLTGPLESTPSNLVSVGDSIYFAAEDGIHGREVWRTENPATWLVGDINGDKTVSFADFLVLASNFGQATEQGVADGDLDASGAVDFADFLLLSENFGR